MKIIFVILMLVFLGCGKDEILGNRVHFDQINSDNSTNYRYVFRDKIEEERYGRLLRRKRTF